MRATNVDALIELTSAIKSSNSNESYPSATDRKSVEDCGTLVENRSSARIEIGTRNAFQMEMADFATKLLEGESRMCAALSIALLKDQDMLVRELKNLRGKPSTWGRKKLKVRYAIVVKRKRAIFR